MSVRVFIFFTFVSGKTCPAVVEPENGSANCTDDNVFGSRCSFSCNEGYQLEGRSLIKCTGEGWDFGSPICESKLKGDFLDWLYAREKRTK